MASLTKRKSAPCQQHGLVHQAVLIMGHAINAALWHKFSRPVLLVQNLFVLHYVGVPNAREQVILKTSKVADKCPNGHRIGLRNIP